MKKRSVKKEFLNKLDSIWSNWYMSATSERIQCLCVSFWGGGVNVGKGAVFTVAISGVTVLILIIFAHDVTTILPIYNIATEYFWIKTAIFLSVSERQSAEWRSFCQFCTKLVAMATSIEELEKEVQVDHLWCRNAWQSLAYSPLGAP